MISKSRDRGRENKKIS